MGPSGSGKTTFLSMLGGLLRTTAGEIWIDETNIAILTERELPPFRARTFGFIFQDFNLIAALSARENVEVALNIAGERGKPAMGEPASCSSRWASPAGSTSRLKALRRREAAGRDRARDRQPPDADSGRRADREPRLGARRGDDASAPPSRQGGGDDSRYRQPRRTSARGRRPRALARGRTAEGSGRARPRPGCRMLLDPQQAPASLEEDGSLLYFCSRGCRPVPAGAHRPDGSVPSPAGTPMGYRRREGAPMRTKTYSVPAFTAATARPR